MEGKLRHQSAGPHEDAGIGDNQPINSELLQGEQIRIKTFQVLVMGQDIDGHIDFDGPLMGIADRLGHGLLAEISRLGPQTEVPAAQIDGIGTIVNGGHQFFKGSSRGQQLRHDRHGHFTSVAAFFFFHGKVVSEIRM